MLKSADANTVLKSDESCLTSPPETYLCPAQWPLALVCMNPTWLVSGHQLRKFTPILAESHPYLSSPVACSMSSGEMTAPDEKHLLLLLTVLGKGMAVICCICMHNLTLLSDTGDGRKKIKHATLEQFVCKSAVTPSVMHSDVQKLLRPLHL